MMLFWFGVFAQLLITFVLVWNYYSEGYSNLLPIHQLNLLVSINTFAYRGLAHFIHIAAAYWLAKGRKKGLIVGLFISIYEILSFFVGGINLGTLVALPTAINMEQPWIPSINPELFTPAGFIIRVLFAIIIFLIISGRKDLPKLQTQNWRPWKNPRSTDR